MMGIFLKPSWQYNLPDNTDFERRLRARNKKRQNKFRRNFLIVTNYFSKL